MRTIRWIPVMVLAFAACAGDGSGPNAARGRIALSVSSQQPAAAPGAANVLLAGDSTVIAANPDTVIVRSVDLVLRRIKLEPVEVAACEDDDVEEQDGENNDTADVNDTESDEDSEGCEEIKAGPVLVSLPLGTATVEALVDVSAPAGQYNRLQFKIHAPKVPRDSAFLRVNPTFAAVSIRVSGTFSHAGTRNDFTYESALEVEQEVTLDPPISVGTGAVASLTLRFDLSGWFAVTGGSGLVDPASANVGGANAELVANNIRRSINAFEDEDEDGHDDHDGGDDGGGH